MCGILVVDDDADNLELIRRMLERRGLYATFAESGIEALERMEARNVSVLLTDLHMPEMSGLTLATLAREVSPRLTVVLMTGDSRPELPRIAADAGISCILLKPFSPQQLISSVQGAD